MKRRRSGLPAAAPDMDLPVRKQSSEILSALAANDVLLVMAETGSGKTTQLPQIIVDSDTSASVVVTQPRRVAAVTVAARVAAERGVELGAEVGYAVRFDDRSTRGVTNIRYVTDGVLLREALSDGPATLKKRYSHVIIDEVHERSINTDLVLGIIKETLTRSPSKAPMPANGFAAKNEMFAKMIRSKLPFKVVIMSATTDADKIMKFFRENTSLSVFVMQIPGRQHDVKVMNAVHAMSDYIVGAVTAVEQVDSDSPLPGDILVFLPGQEEIMTAIASLKEKQKQCPADRELRILPLFAALSPEDQIKAIEPLPKELEGTVRKVIFSTNIAETSITIPGIAYVVDSGLVKVRGLVSEKGVSANVLRIQPVSKAQADQRKGRAGRTGPGVLFRLYTEGQFHKLERYLQPEVLRVDASSTVLQIFALRNSSLKDKSTKEASDGEKIDVRTFPLLDEIPSKVLEHALYTLVHLGAVSGKMVFQDVGKLMSRIPVPPMLARSLLESLRVGCVDSMVSLAAVLSVEGSVLLSPSNKRDKAEAAHRRFLSPCGDHLTLVNALNSFLEQEGEKRRRIFCRDHFLNYRTLVAAESIRGQLDFILQHGDMVSWGLQNPLPAVVAAKIEDAAIDELVRRCIVAGFFQHTARKRSEDGKYVPVGSSSARVWVKGVDIHPSSALRALKAKRNPQLVIYDELVMTSKAYLRTVVSVESDWLTEHSTFVIKSKSSDAGHVT